HANLDLIKLYRHSVSNHCLPLFTTQQKAIAVLIHHNKASTCKMPCYLNLQKRLYFKKTG
ncbi:hypothetical protein, partial [Acinetobacter baumannii]|uniref:hypothetical protein n=1 Tax=Acinetobacter baumannii TaxID=470 RepID=UPI00223A7CBE